MPPQQPLQHFVSTLAMHDDTRFPCVPGNGLGDASCLRRTLTGILQRETGVSALVVHHGVFVRGHCSLAFRVTTSLIPLHTRIGTLLRSPCRGFEVCLAHRNTETFVQIPLEDFPVHGCGGESRQRVEGQMLFWLRLVTKNSM